MSVVEAWLLVAMSLVLRALPPADANILGGGPKKTDCYAEFEGIDATGSKSNVVECVDGNPACHHDLERGKCTFQFRICSFVTGVDGCTPLPLKKLSPRKLEGR